MHTLPKWAKVALPFALLSLLLVAGLFSFLPQHHAAHAANSGGCPTPSIWINDGGQGNAGIDVYIDGATPEGITVNGHFSNSVTYQSGPWSNSSWGASSELQSLVKAGDGRNRAELVYVWANVQWGYGGHTSCTASVHTSGYLY